MLKHFDARAAEYHAEIFSGNQRETSLDESDNPVSLPPLSPSNDARTEQPIG
jgi:hypothetical protein